MANYALAKDKVIVNVIVADADFIELIKADYDEIIEMIVDENNVPNIGMGYTKVKTKWVAPVPAEAIQPAVAAIVETQGEV